MTHTIRPLSDQLFCEPVTKANKTSSGLYIAQSEQKSSAQAKVVNVGPDAKGFQAGDIIGYKEYSATEFELNNTIYVVIAATDVLGHVVEVED